ncbi:MAG: hypothetical protein K6T73_02200 [Candidatus Bathyarchaeota archaeon]|nr:hypothetical protein [Candidatus Bathyarchaeota archaeon]
MAKLLRKRPKAGKVYEKSGDETLAQLAEGYYTMQEEAKHLAKLVEKQLQEYNKEILESSAVLADAGDVWNCVFCLISIALYFVGADPSCSICAACVYASWFIWWLIIGCIPVCTFCILALSLTVYDCCMCAEYMGWIDCPFG